MIWFKGDIWEPETTIQDARTKTNVDPSTVTLTVTNPAGEAAAPVTMTKREVGVYTAQVQLTEAGKWHGVIKTTGTYQGARPETITVYAT